jgi:hypothetical protein
MDDYTSFLSCPITIVALFIVPHFSHLAPKSVISKMPWKYNSQVLRISCTLLGPYKKYSETLALMNYHALLPMPLEMCHHSKE